MESAPAQVAGQVMKAVSRILVEQSHHHRTDATGGNGGPCTRSYFRPPTSAADLLSRRGHVAPHPVFLRSPGHRRCCGKPRMCHRLAPRRGRLRRARQ
eukprot:7073692-Prymnesium_polylepis.1